jgi:nucleotide-binding universal stress UspA family protein
MFERILVPLDGSRLAEDVLVPVGSLARHLDSKVTLLHVLERDAPRNVHGERHITDAAEGAHYLDEVAASLEQAGVEAQTHVHTRTVDSVAVAIDTHAHEYDADLIAMCRHGGSTFREKLVGSIAQQILKGGGTPIFLRTPSERPPGFELKRILVPLDLRHDVDKVLEVSSGLSREYGARLHLLTAVPSLADARRGSASARLLPSTTVAELAMEQEAAVSQLRARGEQLASEGIEVEVTLSQEEPASAILDEASSAGAELIVLITHGRAGFETWLEGTVGGRVIAGAPQNMLLLREP